MRVVSANWPIQNRMLEYIERYSLDVPQSIIATSMSVLDNGFSSCNYCLCDANRFTSHSAYPFPMLLNLTHTRHRREKKDLNIQQSGHNSYFYNDPAKQIDVSESLGTKVNTSDTLIIDSR